VFPDRDKPILHKLLVGNLRYIEPPTVPFGFLKINGMNSERMVEGNIPENSNVRFAVWVSVAVMEGSPILVTAKLQLVQLQPCSLNRPSPLHP